jgi:hypothetical protein
VEISNSLVLAAGEMHYTSTRFAGQTSFRVGEAKVHAQTEFGFPWSADREHAAAALSQCRRGTNEISQRINTSAIEPANPKFRKHCDSILLIRWGLVRKLISGYWQQTDQFISSGL